MKKKLFWIAAAVSIVVTLSASVWEGAATVDSTGTLPDSGYYVATNSFPRNTIVDLTNLETGTSIRVIVADTLNSPGLLAVVSKGAATAIGLQNRSVGRIRMSMPADPIAFSRFTEGLSTSGDPDRDPKAAVTAGSTPGATPVMPPTAPAVATPVTPAPKSEAPATAPEVAAPAPSALASEPSTATVAVASPVPASVPPASTPSTGASTTDLSPGASTPVSPPASASSPTADEAVKSSETATPETATPSPAEGSVAAVLAPSPDTETAAPPEAVPSESQTPESPSKASTSENTDATVTTNEIVDVPESYAPPTTEKKSAETVPETTAPVPPTQKAGPVDLALVPAESRPPKAEPDTSLSAQAEVAPITEPKPQGQESIPLDVPQVAPPPTASLPGSTAPGKVPEPAPGAAKAPLPASVPPVGPTAKSGSVNFGVPVIEKLQKGSYYVQVAALSKEQLVQDAIHQLGPTYPLAVQRAGTPDKPLYRVLVGPINQGESAALLQRFKRIGYSDAFIKTEG